VREYLDVSNEVPDLTDLLRQGRGGNRSAFNEVMRVVYGELRRQAAHYLRQQPPRHTLQPTALVHELYLRLLSRSQPDWQDRAHFFGAAATIMRQILVDHARAKCAVKRGGAQIRVEFNETLEYSDERAADLIALDEALKELAAFDPEKARALELRYFGGLAMEEMAEVLSISISTVRREIRYAEAWLRRELERP
jgi:RNA polymerase sigma factor (TIGR02999 family)